MVTFPFHQVEITTTHKQDGSIPNLSAYQVLLQDKQQTLPSKLIEMNQVHGHHLEYVSSTGPMAAKILATDGLITDDINTALLIKTADCLPIVLTSDSRPVVAALHAGWKGLAAGIHTLALTRLKEQFGLPAEQVYAYLGPGIRSCCYVFHDAPTQTTDPAWRPFIQPAQDGWHIDLSGFARASLLNAGLPEDHLLISGDCTCHQSDRYFSYFRHKRTGNPMGLFATVVQLKDQAYVNQL